MHIAVFGASGATGCQIVSQALARNWKVTAVVRNADSLKDVQHENLNVRVANIFDTDSSAAAIQGCDVILSTLGPRGFSNYLPWANVTIYSESMKCIVAAMKKVGISRVVTLTGACTKYSPENPWSFEWLLKPLIRAIVADMARMEDYLCGSECSDVAYTVVKPTNLTNGPITDSAIKAVEGQYAGGMYISRADVARFMLDCTTSEEWSRKLVAICP